MEALRGADRSVMGTEGLRPAFRSKELGDILDTMFDKLLHLRSEAP